MSGKTTRHNFKCNPEMEILGAALLPYLDNVNVEITEPIFRKHFMMEVDPEKWYPLQPLLDVLKALYNHPGSMMNMIAVGVKIAEFGVEPEDTINAPLQIVLEHWHDHMHKHFRKGNPGEIITEKVHDKFYKITQKNMFPDDLCYGLAYGFARSRLPLGTNFKVWYEDFDNRIDKGNADKTVICVEWE